MQEKLELIQQLLQEVASGPFVSFTVKDIRSMLGEIKNIQHLVSSVSGLLSVEIEIAINRE
ncbi:MAG: hypothetical protein WA055_00045 [Candidatus Moraniibacteriota bacterium]